MLQCVAACCSVLPHFDTLAKSLCLAHTLRTYSVDIYVALRPFCSISDRSLCSRTYLLQCVAVCCIVLQYVAGVFQVCCSVTYQSASVLGSKMSHYNTLQTHLQRTCNTPSTHCNILQSVLGFSAGGVDVCCNVLQCVVICCSVLQCVAVWCRVVQCVAVCCSMLQCVSVYCSVLQCVVVCCSELQVCCSVLQCVAGVLQYVAVCCRCFAV